MSEMAIVYMTAFMALAFILMSIAIFVIGFFVGYRSEDKKIFKRVKQEKVIETHESDEEKKAKKDWKKFLEYDGSTSKM